MRSISQLLRPTMCAESFADIDIDRAAELSGEEIKVLSTDGDGSLLEHGGKNIPFSYRKKLEEIGDGVILAITSNADSEEDNRRVNYIADQAAEAKGTDVIRVTSGVVGKRKPHKDMYERVSKESGYPLRNIAHDGDQIFKDILGANLAECGASILLPPYFILGEHPLTHWLQRPAEAVLRPFLGMPCLTSNFDKAKPFNESVTMIPSSPEGYENAARLMALGAAATTLAGIAEISYDQIIASIPWFMSAVGLGDMSLFVRRLGEANDLTEDEMNTILVGDEGLEPPTSSLSVTRSNQLS
jgi:predicted HAD superfamily phosphohydrolase YqeG